MQRTITARAPRVVKQDQDGDRRVGEATPYRLALKGVSVRDSVLSDEQRDVDLDQVRIHGAVLFLYGPEIEFKFYGLYRERFNDTITVTVTADVEEGEVFKAQDWERDPCSARRWVGVNFLRDRLFLEVCV